MIFNTILGGGGGLEVIDVGSGSVSAGYFMDEACTEAATLEKVIAKADDAVLYRKLMNAASWSSGSDAEVQATIAAAKAGGVDLTQYWSVGDTRTVSLSAMAATGVGESHVAQNVQIVLMHKNWVDANGVKHPFLWGLKDGLANGTSGEYGYMNSSNTNNGGWTSCAMRQTHLPAILALMPTEVKSGIREVNKLTSAGSKSSTINTTADKLFLLSEVEIFVSTPISAAGEGTQYDYYKAGNSKVKKQNGSATVWWERSPRVVSSTDFCVVSSNGDANYGKASVARGVAFGLCF